MDYRGKIFAIVKDISSDVMDLTVKRKRGNPPTQAFSDFLTRNEQGRWAEMLLLSSLKSCDPSLIPVHYGRSDRIAAGDPGFRNFYSRYQDELDTIGKRPDILLFNPGVYEKECGDNFEQFTGAELARLVPMATAGLEVRSSAYLTKKFIPKKGRPFLSFTPKLEDLLLVLKWVEIFNTPHFYVQVFFDSVYIISFRAILSLLRDADIMERGVQNKKLTGLKNRETVFIIEKNPKNQYKDTVHIFLSNGYLLSNRVSEPESLSLRRELANGRLLYYTGFTGGEAILDPSVLKRLIEQEV